jgi:hypothetical protein
MVRQTPPFDFYTFIVYKTSIKTNMPFDIFIAYVSWGNGGKNRPVLVLERRDAVVSVS